MKVRLAWALLTTVGAMAAACSSNSGTTVPIGASGESSGSSSGASGASGASESGASDAGVDATVPTCITPTTVQGCTVPVMTTLPICNLSLTGCMDPTAPTNVNSKAVYYEVNTPLWSDSAAKTRAFVLPTGGKIHVKNCNPNAGDGSIP